MVIIMNSTHDRDPKKRKVKPVESAQQLLDFDLEESSDDSDFRIEDHVEESDDDDSLNSDDANDRSDDSDDSSGSEDDDKQNSLVLDSNKSVSDIIQQAKNRLNDGKIQFDKKLHSPICSGCLGDRSDDANEIVECDGCGATVHEGCYGVSDAASVSSTVSSCSTEPWFCEACKAGVTNPQCELCPNGGGIFKETDVGKWVHLVCALYVPGVAFGEVDHLSSVTLFEMPYNKWGAKTCCLCEDERFARTGVCIGCDAGMCKTFFHVTCAQREGLLSEAHTEEVDQADPFYAHCKLHSDKTLIRKRKRNYLALQLQTQHRKQEQEIQDDDAVQQRIQRKLKKHRIKYLQNKTLKTAPWVPTQKMPRLLTTSASACRRLMHKALLMGIDTEALEIQDAQIAALTDVRKKWNIPPAFSVEFIGYYLDRNKRVSAMKNSLEQLLDMNTKLLAEQKALRDKYDEAVKDSSEHTRANISLKQTLDRLHTSIAELCPAKTLPSVESLGRSVPAVVVRTMGVPTAAALKMGVGFPLNPLPEGGDGNGSGKVLSTSRQESLLLNNECGICKKRHDQHLLAKCDMCHLYYHLGCLNPPLTRLPKKSKLYGWQCSECDKSSDSEPDISQPKAPRKSRTRYSKDGSIISANAPDTSDTIDGIAKPQTADEQPQELTISPDSKAAKSEVGSLKFTIKSVDKTVAPTVAPSEANFTSDVTMIQDGGGLVGTGGEALDFVKRPAKSKSNKKSRKEKRNHIQQESYFVQNSAEQEQTNNSAFQENSFLSQGSTFRPLMADGAAEVGVVPIDVANASGEAASGCVSPNTLLHRQNRKRRKEKHRNRYSPDFMRSPSKEHKRKRKKKIQDMENPNVSHPRITIKIKSIPLPAGEVASTSNPQMFYVPCDSNDAPPQLALPKQSLLQVSQISITEGAAEAMTEASSDFLSPEVIAGKQVNSRRSSLSASGTPLRAKPRESSDTMLQCDVCQTPGTNQNIVRCDECQKCYHFSCLDPPVKKTPKRRGYSWHCADCDPTETDST